MVPKSSAGNLVPPQMPVNEESYSNDSSKQTIPYRPIADRRNALLRRVETRMSHSALT